MVAWGGCSSTLVMRAVAHVVGQKLLRTLQGRQVVSKLIEMRIGVLRI